MRWRMRIGHYEPTTVVTLDEGRISPAFETEELRRYHGFPGLTDEDLFCLTFHEFSRSSKVARLDEGPLTPREVYDRGATVYARAWEERQRRSQERGKRRRAMNGYVEICEELYRSWSEGRLSEIGWMGDLKSQLERRKVSFDYAPEPYLLFDGADIEDADAPQLVFLTTNPGGGEDFQSREGAAGRSTYREFQDGLVQGQYSKAHSRIGPAAQRRIERMREIAERLKPTTGATGFVQCEVVPFHSGTLPNKRGLTKWLREQGRDGALSSYLSRLKAFLEGKHVIAIDASNAPASRDWEHWLRYKAGLFSFDPTMARQTCLGKSSEGRASSCVFTQSEKDLVRAYYLTQGGNSIRDHVKALCEAILADGPL